MTDLATLAAYGVLTAPATLTIERRLPGPIERIWAYLTESDLRRQWLAAGEMEMRVGAPFEFVWRNDELTDPPGRRPDESSEEHRMTCRITELDPPRRLVITWGANEAGEVAFTLVPEGEEVVLTIVHRRVPDRTILLNVSSGWHAHLDVLAARARGETPEPFWDHWSRLRREYETRLPA
ncbi:SRPBCC family protein [Enterovirga rhinocerotis]|uniref:Uncharacterized protein YndB with AHSA1/START domain n=1 Tax=Enterovirga rhinocerotis TaxID=1339210 RepID=A0A4R7CA44_9HYPH|nr:SRPBCC family protein [Enterovirga rhinocerotis]TDR93836.1 uncharacterized protein YndB with AHSA1/START domain [Enterovirga rhinocerotis]